ncbi:MAG: hypothetical protein V4466_12065 [Pseudomonadota bacterium]
MAKAAPVAPDEITVTMTRVEALALARVADTGIRVTEALGLIQSTASAERGLNALNAAAAGRRGRGR